MVGRMQTSRGGIGGMVDEEIESTMCRRRNHSGAEVSKRDPQPR